MGWGIGTVRRPARRLSRARYTHHDGGTGGRMESERQQSWSALKRRHAAFAAPFLKCYFIWTVTALTRHVATVSITRLLGKRQDMPIPATQYSPGRGIAGLYTVQNRREMAARFL